MEAERIAPLTETDVADLCASFQAAVVDVVVDRTRVALRAFRDIAGPPAALVVAGGVAANQTIRRGLERLAGEAGLRMIAPPPAAVRRQRRHHRLGRARAAAARAVDDLTVPARARWPLGEPAGDEACQRIGETRT